MQGTTVSAENVKPYKTPAKPVTSEYLSGPGCLRLQHLMYLYGRSYSAVNRQIKAGHIPPPTGHDPRAYWNNDIIRAHLKGSESNK